MENKLLHCSDCSLLSEFQPCEACPNYEYQSRMKLMQKVVSLREQRYNAGCPEDTEEV
jgi:recombinational DNA repair protein RecR